MSNQNFIQKCLDGEAFADEINEYVNVWHTTNQAQQLREFLGFTIGEYMRWMMHGEEMLQQILDERTALMQNQGQE